ncbi:hypothetical protein B0H13DRAFT_1909571 [Mycena leptocephala]|nr:hypothetical protein B0H13DRAFT_1909571 [Mycena leptocephala]
MPTQHSRTDVELIDGLPSHVLTDFHHTEGLRCPTSAHALSEFAALQFCQETERLVASDPEIRCKGVAHHNAVILAAFFAKNRKVSTRTNLTKDALTEDAACTSAISRSKNGEGRRREGDGELPSGGWVEKERVIADRPPPAYPAGRLPLFLPPETPPYRPLLSTSASLRRDTSSVRTIGTAPAQATEEKHARGNILKQSEGLVVDPAYHAGPIKLCSVLIKETVILPGGRRKDGRKEGREGSEDRTMRREGGREGETRRRVNKEEEGCRGKANTQMGSVKWRLGRGVRRDDHSKDSAKER